MLILSILISILVWNVTLDQRTIGAHLDRQVTVRVAVPAGVSYMVRHFRIDADHSNITRVWAEMGGGSDWPDDRQWALLREANTLDELVPATLVAGEDGLLELSFELPMPSVSCLELVP